MSSLHRLPFMVRLIVVLITAGPAMAHAKAITLPPSSGWVLKHDDDGCRLARQFGSGKETSTLLLDMYQPSVEIDVSVIGRPFFENGAVKVPVQATFGPSLSPGVGGTALAATIGPNRTPMLLIGPRDLLNRKLPGGVDERLSGTTVEQRTNVTEMTIRTSHHTVVLQVGAMGDAMIAMDRCTENLVQTWGLDPKRQATASRRARPTESPESWLTPPDYPMNLLNESAKIDFRLIIDEAGNPTACKVQRATNSPEFVDLTCQLLMRRARFQAALDAEGKPMPSYYVNTVRWITAY